jgi:hypothetical protein
MPLNKRYSKPLSEQLTKDLYCVPKRIKLPAPEHLLKKYNVQPHQVLIPLQRRHHLRGCKDILLDRWESLAKSFGKYIQERKLPCKSYIKAIYPCATKTYKLRHVK